ncbi:hypothetical protein [Streptomyces europaeiscabiei]|uniref:hypothetical protein n=1 Tax=Streptomyces europaeiscabiei TaxID=146819 RepID=UPI0029B6D225|nr:hypothetical protein [Streptomyces europaeiscabiei]MDX3611306.1 hypothetical protein [Streptomyces europaeiscabiei]
MDRLPRTRSCLVAGTMLAADLHDMIEFLLHATRSSHGAVLLALVVAWIVLGGASHDDSTPKPS